ncbi:hypothetical protein [Streptomyces sp. SAS_275]|uniref:hypothetical protein n=1 Tax=Streptomyces sp. SAS_275 TaxID=3412746 RepID=UPI00403C4EDF
MKLTHRDDWHVIVEIAPRATHIPLSALGFDLGDRDLDGELDGLPFEITVSPRRLGDLGGGITMGDRLISRDVDAAYRARCEAMLTAMLRQPHVKSGRVTCKETHTCSHCDLGWEVLSADDVLDEANCQDAYSVEGEPVCCEAGIDEFRTEHGIPTLADAAAVTR